MNKNYRTQKILGFVLSLGISMPSLAAGVTPANCTSLIGPPVMTVNSTNCVAQANTIRQCIQNSLASQTPSSSGSVSTQIQASSTASQTLAMLDFQCQYYANYNPEPQSTGPGAGGIGGTLKSMLGIGSQSAKPSAATALPATNAAISNQASKLNSLEATKVPPAKSNNSGTQNNSNTKENNSNSINWF